MAHQLPHEVMRSCDGMFYCLFKWVYAVTNGLGPMALLLGFSVVLYMATVNRFGGTRAFGFSSIVGLMGAIWLGTMQLIAWPYATMFILAGVIGLVAMILSER